MAYTGVQRPTNKIVANGSPLIQELRVQTATNMYPGRLVKAGSSVDEIVVNDASTNTTIIGFIGFEQTNPNYRPSTIDTIQVIEDQVSVLNGGGFTILAGAVGAIAKGNPLAPAAAGKVQALALADMVVGAHVGYA
ncbi:MAG: hypothetical protein U9N43_05950, partial [Euryarchaeota archaeon]|nr:hypothetical protein [Euryarchaeota archaeon]